ncbi:Chromobox protein-like protein 8 [Heterocephalus glaber]|uniref:Chromobox protein-like protein 8 n=1 Tax=Heterocephalus glaber TaxID=10181 RepID=G5C4T0_HETGA|nr:Chromobox protein-like protein 8 [Heterocephalus glaber]
MTLRKSATPKSTTGCCLSFIDASKAYSDDWNSLLKGSSSSTSNTCRADPPWDLDPWTGSESERGSENEKKKEEGEPAVWTISPALQGTAPRSEAPSPGRSSWTPSQRPLGEPSDGLGDSLKGRKLDDIPSGAGKFPAGHSVIQLARRQDSDLVQCGVTSPSSTEATGKLAVDTFPARVIKHRATFLEAKGQGALDPGGPRVRHGSGTPGSVGSLYRDMGAQGGRPSLIARIPVARILGDPEEESWSPSLTNLEKVVVTDVTSNFLTVTIKESNTDQGFFKEKR